MKLSIIHLSDIHIKGDGDTILERVDRLKAACIHLQGARGIFRPRNGKNARYFVSGACFSRQAKYISQIFVRGFPFSRGRPRPIPALKHQPQFRKGFTK